jgi:hypothetical protein
MPKKKPVKDYLIINRAKWKTGGSGKDVKGHGLGTTCLLNSTGFQCCLGFRCQQMGIPRKHLLHRGAPCSLESRYDIPDLITEDGKNSDFTNKAIEINDSVKLTHEERERQLIEWFATKDIIVEFKGEYM